MLNSRSSNLRYGWLVAGWQTGVKVEAETERHHIHSRHAELEVASVVRHLGLDRLSPHSAFCSLLLKSRLLVSMQRTSVCRIILSFRRLHIMLGDTTKVFSNLQTSRDQLKKIIRRRGTRRSGLDVATRVPRLSLSDHYHLSYASS